MKNLIIMITFFALIFLNANCTNGQDMTISSSYLIGEKSKDSHSTSEKISINGTSVSYSVKYSGHKGKNDIDMDKSCEFTEQDLKNIRKTIETKSLNVTDSLFQENSKYKSFEVYTNISIAISMDGQEYKIRINGDTAEFKDSQLYKNSLYFITLLSKMAKDCK